MWLQQESRPLPAFIAACNFEIFVADELHEWEAEWQLDTYCFADVLQLWLQFGDATQTCRTHGDFLAAVVCILDTWMSQPPGSRSTYVGHALRPSRPESAITLFSNADETLGSKYLHPVLREDLFRMMVAKHERRAT